MLLYRGAVHEPYSGLRVNVSLTHVVIMQCWVAGRVDTVCTVMRRAMSVIQEHGHTPPPQAHVASVNGMLWRAPGLVGLFGGAGGDWLRFVRWSLGCRQGVAVTSRCIRW